MRCLVGLALAIAPWASGCGKALDERDLIITDESLEAKGMSLRLDPALPENQKKRPQETPGQGQPK